MRRKCFPIAAQMNVNQSVLLNRLPAELLASVLEVEDVLDLLQLSVSCSLMRESMNDLFWKRVLIERYAVLDEYINHKAAVAETFVRNCHECRSSDTYNLPVHQIVRKRTCAYCLQTKFRTIFLQDATKSSWS